MIPVTDAYRIWWKKFDGSKLETPVTTLRDEIIDRINNSDFEQARSIIPFFEACANELESARDIADVWVEIGMAYFRMHERDRAEQYWQRAVRVYPPTSHDNAVARWLLGTAQWFIEEKHSDAIRHWKGAINEFIDLADLAQKENREQDKDWYDERTKEMEDSLAEAISKRFQ